MAVSKDNSIPKCKVLRLNSKHQLINTYPSIHAAAAAIGVKPETLYSYCRTIGKTLKGSYFMAY